MKCTLLLASLILTGNSRITDKTPVAEKALLWEISGNGLKKSSYLLGTFHLANYSFVDSIPGARKAFINSELLITEIKGDSNGMLVPDFSSMYMQDTSLSTLLTPDQYERLGFLLKKWMGMDVSMMNNIRPGFVNAFLIEAMMMQLHGKQGFTEKMDLGLMKDAHKMEKESAGLESMEFQMNMLRHLGSLERQAQQLAEFVMDTSKAKKQLLDLYVHYRKGDLNALYDMSREDYSMSEAEYVKLLVDRNTAWLTVLPAYFKKNSCFVAVGALHLPGPDGLIHRLRKMGYTVKPVKGS